MYICRYALVSRYVCVCVYIQMTRCVSMSIRNQLTGKCIHQYTHCQTLQQTATCCNILQHSATSATYRNIKGPHRRILNGYGPRMCWLSATRCNTSQHTATHRNTLQHTGASET